jgi:hypothetical protein
MEEAKLSLILGMDILVFLAWIGTILATILCVIYGLYYQFIKKSSEETPTKVEDDSKKKEDE